MKSTWLLGTRNRLRWHRLDRHSHSSAATAVSWGGIVSTLCATTARRPAFQRSSLRHWSPETVERYALKSWDETDFRAYAAEALGTLKSSPTSWRRSTTMMNPRRWLA